MYLRDKYCSVNDNESYVYWRNKATELKRVSKSIYYMELIIANKNNTRKLWKRLSELAPKENLQDPVTLKDGETTLSDPQDICECFNKFFTNIALSLTHNMPLPSDDVHAKLQEFINCRTYANTSFEIPLITQETMEKELNGLEDGKAVGLDGIPPKLLQLSASAISHPLTYILLTYILNQSIKTTIFPDEWKTAKVVPLHKKDSTQFRENFRPISVLSTLSKLLERHIHTHFYRFLVDDMIMA